MNHLFLKNITLKIVLINLILGSITNIYSQKTYKVTYYILEPKLFGSIDNLDEKGKQFSEEIFERAKSINYILITNKLESYFEAENNLSQKNDSPYEQVLVRMAKRFTSFNEMIYSNHKNDSIIFVKNLVNKDFIVKRGNYNFNWTLKNETKQILGFEAKKAEGLYYYPITNEELKVEAWYIPTIPLKSGPDIFIGLPGLIVELNLKGAVVTVKMIETIDDIKIKKIDDSKSITQQEYDDLIKSLTKKYIEN